MNFLRFDLETRPASSSPALIRTNNRPPPRVPSDSRWNRCSRSIVVTVDEAGIGPAHRGEVAVRDSTRQFNELLLAELPHLRRYALALTGTADAADDLVQDTIERALRKHRLWRPEGRLRGWLMRMLYRLHANRHKRRRLERDHALKLHREQEATPLRANETELRQECRDLVRALDTLPEGQRAAILLIALEDVDYREAAWILDIPVGTLRSRLSRARETLREQTGTDADAPLLRTVN